MEIKKFRGIRNVNSAERLKVGELETATNVDTDNTGKLLTRKGLTQVSASASHSLYANHIVSLVVQNSVLKRIEPDGSLTNLRQLSSNARVSYDTVRDTVYYSNGTDTGRIVGSTPKPWGITPPTQPQAAASPTGTLPPGRYMYAITYLRSDGQESGTPLAGQITLSAAGGIRFYDIEGSTEDDISGIMLYLSGVDGEEMFLVAELPNGTTTYTVTEPGSGPILITQFAEPAPAGSIVRHYNGSMYVVVGNVVYISDPYSHELFRKDENFLQFPADVAMFEPVNAGVYVATADVLGDDAETNGATWFMDGSGPGKFSLVQLFDYGVIPGSAVTTAAAHFESQQEVEADGAQGRLAVVWTNRHGVCVGRDSANVQNLTEGVYSFPSAPRAAGVVRQHRGYVNYVVTLQGAGSADNKYTGG